MTKSTITREQLIKKAQEQIEFCRHTKITGEGRAHVNQCAALFEIALAAMDSSESVELPLDYLQGHKDGLEWAARLAEANHPETGDWLYDDPIELAKAIRKGPDMPPVQPAADSEPVAWKVRFKLEGQPGSNFNKFFENRKAMNDVVSLHELGGFNIDVTPLYHHAQQPVVPVSQKEPISFDDWSRKCALQVTLCYSDFREKAQYIWDSARETMHVEPSVPVLTRADFESWCKKRFALSPSYFEKDASGVYTGTLVHDMYIAWEACRAAMLKGGKS